MIYSLKQLPGLNLGFLPVRSVFYSYICCLLNLKYMHISNRQFPVASLQHCALKKRLEKYLLFLFFFFFVGNQKSSHFSEAFCKVLRQRNLLKAGIAHCVCVERLQVDSHKQHQHRLNLMEKGQKFVCGPLISQYPMERHVQTRSDQMD